VAYVVGRVVICNASGKPRAHYELLPSGRSRRIAGVVGKDARPITVRGT
jgi:hypothetical protein